MDRDGQSIALACQAGSVSAHATHVGILPLQHLLNEMQQEDGHDLRMEFEECQSAVQVSSQPDFANCPMSMTHVHADQAHQFKLANNPKILDSSSTEVPLAALFSVFCCIWEKICPPINETGV